jgi:5-methylcytosine-specific restriction protein A
MAAALKSYRRDNPYCQWPGCPRLADQTDHIVPLAEGGDRYNRTNLQSLCTPHHKTKTVADARRGKTRAR